MTNKRQAKRTVDKDVFIEEYCTNGGNGVQAIIAAGFSGRYGSARVSAHRLLTNASIKETIAKRKAELQAEIEKTTRITRESQVEDLERIAQEAREKSRFSAAVSAKRAQSELLGHFNRPEDLPRPVLPPVIVCWDSAHLDGDGKRTKQIESKALDDEEKD